MKLNITNLSDFIVPFDEYLLDTERTRRDINIDNVCKYWIWILDHFFWWILPSELVVIWADTGVWKSEMWYKVAVENAKRGKKVILFALEWDIQEMWLRYIQQEVSRNMSIRSKDFRFNTLDIKEQTDKVLIPEDRYENLYIYRKKFIPDIDQLIELIDCASPNFDMFVVDHLNYIDFWDRANEVESIWKVMRKLKTLTDNLKKPVILMSHLRKRDKKEDPTEFDLYWSSNVAKEATTIILLSKYDNMSNNKLVNYMFDRKDDDYKRYSSTKLIAQKSRSWLPVKTTFSLVYDLHKKMYLDEFSDIIEEESQQKKDDRY